MDLLSGIFLLVCGVIIGALSVIFGIGGSIIAVPLFRIVFGFSGNHAIATALAIVMPTSLSGVVHLSKKELVKYKTAVFGGICGVIASILGALFTQYFSSEYLMFGFGALLLLMALAILIVRENTEVNVEAPILEKSLITALIGLIVGFFSGFFGVGGGLFAVPLLMKLRRIPIKKAIATSLMMISFFALPGTIIHYVLGNIDISIFMIVISGSLIGTKVGASLMVRIDEKTQREL